jgi:cyclic beta-1,2-glucan synthetase
MGAGRPAAEIGMHVITEIDPNSGALFRAQPLQHGVRRPDCLLRRGRYDSHRDRRSDGILGRNGTLRRPAAMKRYPPFRQGGGRLDPCAAIQVSFDLADGQEREIVFRLGMGQDADDARNLVNRFRGSTARTGALEAVWQHWNHTLGACNVETPDQSLNVLANGWLLYQTLACRLWARSATYQSGGAFGFRDQLQDVMALIHAGRISCASTCSVRGPSVPGRRCSALVASALGPGRAHPLFRRLPLAAAGDVPLCPRHRGHRRAG